ncbi:S8 family serine peptidase, partial [PVC group bacterium]|nr:S8 family serine peptidase [PVC group bacterium]
FSSTGDTVELAAPGVNITSVKLGGGYVSYNGTSMASPHVAGVAALVIQSGITDSDGDGNVVNEVRERLQITADDLGDPGRDPYFGFGLVDAAEASTPIGPVNHAPTVTITQPNNSDTFDSSVVVDFQATADDQEEGDVSTNIIWSSSINGIIGSGPSVAVVLSDGEHTITASADDSENATGSDSINITVGTPPPPPPQTALSVSVSTDKPSYVKRDKVLITIVVTDGTNAVESASVNVTIATANGKGLAGSGFTNSDGIVLFEYKVNPKRDGVGTYNVDTFASKSGFDSGGASTTFDVN